MPYSSADIQLGQIKFGGVDPTLYTGSRRPRVAIRVALLTYSGNSLNIRNLFELVHRKLSGLC